MRDQSLLEQMSDMRSMLDRLDQSSRREMDLDDIADRLNQFQNGLDSFLMELKGLPDDIKKNYKRKLKAHKQELEKVRNDYAWKKEQGDREELLGGAQVSDAPDYQTEEGLMRHGKAKIDESGNVLRNILVRVEETKVIGIDTAIKVQEQTNQIEGLYNDLYEIDDTMKRSAAIMKRMFRKVKTDKYLWVMIGLVVIAVVFLLVYKALGYGSDDDGIQGLPPARR